MQRVGNFTLEEWREAWETEPGLYQAMKMAIRKGKTRKEHKADIAVALQDRIQGYTPQEQHLFLREVRKFINKHWETMVQEVAQEKANGGLH